MSLGSDPGLHTNYSEESGQLLLGRLRRQRKY